MISGDSDKKALKSGIWYIASNFAAKGAVFFSTPWFTRIMTKEEIGTFSNISAWVSLLVVITSLELATSITFAKYEYGQELNRFVASVLKLNFLVSTCLYIVVLAFHPFFTKFFGTDFMVLNIIFLYCIFSPALQMIQVKNRVLYQYKFSSVLTLSSVLISILVSLALVLIMNDKVHGRVIGYFGSLIVFNIALSVYLLYLGRTGRKSHEFWPFALSISLPMIIHLLSGQLLNSSDRIMITKMCGSADNALYSIAYTAAAIISTLWTSLNTAWSPWAYDQMDNEDYHRLKKASRSYCLLFFAIIVLFLLFAPEILLLMGGRQYLEAVAVIPPVVIGMFFQFVYSLYVNIEFFHKKQKYTAVGTTIAAAINIGLNWASIPIFGYVAAAYTTLVGYIVLFAIHYYIVYRMGKAWWYDTKFNYTILLLSLVLIPIAELLYEATAARWGLIAAVFCATIVILIINRDIIKSIIKTRSLKPLMPMLKLDK